MKICGREGCVALKNGVGHRFHNSGALYAGSLPRDPGPVRAYRLVMLFGDGNGGVAGRVSMAYSPQLRAMLPLDAEPSAVWSRVTDSAAARLSRLAGELSPLPARHLRAADGTALPPEVWEPSRRGRRRGAGGRRWPAAPAAGGRAGGRAAAARRRFRLAQAAPGS